MSDRLLFDTKPPLAEIDRHIDVLDRAEPHLPDPKWLGSYLVLRKALRRARDTRRVCAAPVVVLAAIVVILLHGEAWDLYDLQWLVLLDAMGVGLLRAFLANVYAPLLREERIQVLLRYFGDDQLERALT